LPFVNPQNIKEKIQWVQPKLVCEIEYAELTADDQLRQTTFLGWRDDKNPKEVLLQAETVRSLAAICGYQNLSFGPPD
jgi:ATP-dependent DNA ligase